ncbi:glycosyltransferase involved in cell wall biosynthesis [Okibacterium sp. HSC-33S16]|uniref:glycosyltransferase family 4 protein n=1 Tax=Okibacterium sp. HSC-33S16 TaxID=2910965 RepID=UPI0020A0CD08|nr:glycosyltransferase family 4 protein [Okibacterium sp. HSC-33S16]MCP2031677.1 glycosyltransferase involved in cell wall biosynthesis [Okibacterium sp. HSC-33S16]
MELGKTEHIPSGIHVLFIVNNYPPSVGGVENHVFHLAKEIVTAGNRASVVALSETASDDVENGVRVVRLRRHFPVAGVISFPALRSARRIAQLFEDEMVTVISTHTRFFPMSAVGTRVAKRLRVPLLHTEHGSDFVRSSSLLVSIASRVVDRTVGRWVLRSADGVLGVSEQVVAFAKRLAGVEGRLFYNAIDLAEWYWAGYIDSVATKPSFCFLGRLVDGKGWDDFVDAAARVRRQPNVPEFKIDIMGDGPDRARLNARIDELGLRSITRVHGQVRPDEVRKQLAGAILVNPTILSEGFQTTLLESIAAGGQIVSYPVPGLDQLIADGAPITKVDARDISSLAAAMKSMLTRPAPQVDLTMLGKWSWSERGRDYLNVVADLRAR